ncbi:MAG: hypothetical protein KDD35_09685 [Bdellovibrionales bacterium]|nr:hypothetical protein [Bdellovibrionales bacterium]
MNARFNRKCNLAPIKAALVALISSSLLISQTSYATQVVHHTAAVTSPSHFSVSSQYYDFSFSGVSKYMDVLRSSDPELFQRLKPEWDNLKSKKMWAYTSLGLGILSFAYGIKKSTESYDPESSGSGNNSAYGYGLGLGLVGYIVFNIINPDREDLLDFINFHNRTDGKNKIDFNLGLFEPSPDQDLVPGLSISSSF